MKPIWRLRKLSLCIRGISGSRRQNSKYFKMAGLFCFRSLHTVRPHIPLIHFPKRFPLGSSTLSGKPSTVAIETNISNNNNESSINNIGAVDDSELPTRYRRTGILPEEILYIERGGPD